MEIAGVAIMVISVGVASHGKEAKALGVGVIGMIIGMLMIFARWWLPL